MRSVDEIEAVLAKAADRRKPLTDDEAEVLRDMIAWWRAWQAWGRLGKLVLWAIITAGAVAAALREMRAGSWWQ